jgi:nitroimidazol reductase NimA-like FMN-containing flavoprotein (pyridoxamine 5'-phosphate oxidase superfamily)
LTFHGLDKEQVMKAVDQGSLELLQHPAAQELLHSKIPARMAYVWMDGTPRVVPIWFHWNGREIVMATPPRAPKLKALKKNPKVSLTIDENDFPQKVLLIRGTARLEAVEGIAAEYSAAADRYFDPKQAEAWLSQLRTLISSQIRIIVTPEWVGLLDFQTRFPSGLSS